MYYNNNDHILIRKLPKNLLKPDGSLWIRFDQENIDTLSDYGYYTVRNDNAEPLTINSTEIVKNRIINLDKPYVDITRTWLDTSEA